MGKVVELTDNMVYKVKESSEDGYNIIYNTNTSYPKWKLMK